MAITPTPVELAEVGPLPLQSPGIDASLPGLSTAARANITIVAAAPDLFEGYLAHLRDDGYAVSLVVSVGEASAQAEALCPDLVFLDLGESSQTGLAMVSELKADACLGAIPLVMLASFDSLDDIKAGLKLGACDYIIKAETNASALARGVPAWAGIDKKVRAGLKKSTARRGVKHSAEVAYWARPRLPAVQT